MGRGSLAVCVVLIVCTACHQAEAASMSVTSTVGVKENEGHQVRCQLTLGSGETFREMSMFRRTSSSSFVVMSSSDLAPVWNNAGADSTLKSRATLSGSPGALSVTVNFTDTRCEDHNQVYKCDASINVGNEVNPVTSDSTTVKVEAAPLQPSAMVVEPSGVSSVMEGTQLQFTCEGNVGLPAGFFQWFIYVGSEYTNVTDDASTADIGMGSGDNSCTFRKRSTLTIPSAERTPYRSDLVARCRVYHPTQGSNNDDMDCGINETFCRQSQAISVQYPVTTSVSPQSLTRVEEQSVTFICSPDSNPTPIDTYWYKDDASNVTLTNSTTLELSNLTLEDAGQYTCISFNRIDGTVFNSSATATLVVNEKPPPTTQPPTTTPGPTTSGGDNGGDGGGGGTADAATAGLTDQEVTIIAVVVVLAVLIAVAVIVIVIICKRRKKQSEVEEPPEKPFNNHAAINTVATQPDVIGDKYPHLNNAGGYKNEDGLTYAELQFDNKPRSRRPLALDDTHTDYSDVSMPQV